MTLTRFRDLLEDKEKDLGIASAIKKTLAKGRKVEIDGKRISQADWAQDSSNPEKAKPIPPSKVIKPIAPKQTASKPKGFLHFLKKSLMR
jgi:hypothetical protein